MNRIKLLDCTLRDGGYVNNWEFGNYVISAVVQKLLNAGIDVIEGGYLSKKAAGSPDCARYKDMQDCQRFYVQGKAVEQNYAVMINYGEFPIEELPLADQYSPILRVAFHKKDIDKAFEYLEEVEKLGYRFFVQPMGAR